MGEFADGGRQRRLVQPDLLAGPHGIQPKMDDTFACSTASQFRYADYSDRKKKTKTYVRLLLCYSYVIRDQITSSSNKKPHGLRMKTDEAPVGTGLCP